MRKRRKVYTESQLEMMEKGKRELMGVNPLSQPRQMTEEEERIKRQESEWIAMEKRITELVDSVRVSNVRIVANQLMSDDIVRGKGLFCQAIMKSQSKFPELSNVYASLVAVINCEFPEVGFLLVKRAVLQFKESFDCKDKKKLLKASKFLAHLVNQRVVYAILALDAMLFLLVDPRRDNVEVAVSFCTQCGSLLRAIEPYKLKEILEEFHRVLKEGALGKSVKLMIMKLFAAKKSMFKNHPSIIDELDLVKDPEDSVIHEVSVLEDIDPETSVDCFDPNSDCEGICNQLSFRFQL